MALKQSPAEPLQPDGTPTVSQLLTHCTVVLATICWMLCLEGYCEKQPQSYTGIQKTDTSPWSAGGDLILTEDAVCETGLASCEPVNL